MKLIGVDSLFRFRSPILQSQRTANVRLYDPTNLVNPMASHSQQSTPSPSPKRSSRRHHHGHHHHYHFGQTSGGAYDLLEPEALQRRHRFPTNFCRMLREYPPPVPPILLRAMPAISVTGSKAAPASALPRYKDPANRVRILLPAFVVLASSHQMFDFSSRSRFASCRQPRQQRMVALEVLRLASWPWIAGRSKSRSWNKLNSHNASRCLPSRNIRHPVPRPLWCRRFSVSMLFFHLMIPR